MSCQICGRPSAPGAKLCADCRAARKRAFDATVTQPLLAAAGAASRSRASPRLLKPNQAVPDAARRAARQAAVAKAEAEAANEASSRRARVPIMVSVLCAVLLVGAYVVHRMVAAHKSESAALEQAIADEGAAPASASVAATAATGAREPVTLPAPATSAAEADAPAPGPAPIETPKPQGARPRGNVIPMQSPIPSEAPPPQVIAAPRAPPPPPVVREPPRPDTWQQMSDAIARCPRDDIFGFATCERRVRMQYCEGHWGMVPQCASIPYVDHGQ